MTNDGDDVTGATGAQGVPATGAVETDEAAAIREFPRRRARTLRFQSGAPRSARTIGDGTRALFLRSDGPEDLVTSLWLSWFDASGAHRETLLADPRELLADADNEHVPAEEKARRERAREGGAGIVSYSVDAAGDRVVFTINGQLFLTEITAAESSEPTQPTEPTARTRQLCVNDWGMDELANGEAGPVLNPRISPDGTHVLYTTGEHLELVTIADWDEAPAVMHTAADGASDAESADDAEVTAVERAVAVNATCPDAHGSIAGVCDANDAAERAGGEGAHGDRTWKIGLAEFVAGEEMDRYDGFWWAPDSRHIIYETFDASPEPVWNIVDPSDPTAPAQSRRYAQALTRNADVRLYVAELDLRGTGELNGFDAREIRWDRKAYEYVARVNWQQGRDPIILVQDRCQRNDRVLAVSVDFAADPADANAAGATRMLEEHHNDQWIDIVDGTPAFTPDGRLICPLNDMDADTNRLTADGVPFTPAGWNVRTVLDVTDHDVLAVVQRTPEVAGPLPQTDDDAQTIAWQRPDEHDARSFDVVRLGFDGSVTPAYTGEPGVWSASRGAKGAVLTGMTMASPRTTMLHIAQIPATDNSDGSGATREVRGEIASTAAVPGFALNSAFVRLGERRMIAVITRPSASSPYAHAATLPVLLKPYGGPGFQQAVAAQRNHWESQWWADQGFIVVTADNRGTTGRGPKWDREMFGHMKDVSIDDQVDAVHALPDVMARELPDGPQPDIDKVCMIGWSFGGFLSALAVLDAPDVVKAACAGAPPTDWTLYDTHYTERYLGLDPEVYRFNGIVQDAPKLARPLMLIHGFADDNVTIAHSLRLSQALMAAGRPHTFLPLAGITHMTNDETVAENLLTLQRDFLYDALGLR
ncbi:cytochrome C [Bifidobacterium sp. DSM 109958]|uniref:Cytochrome C n=1 Tax=Bifidobacterium moraviense TaxID=2675323 RepID=A0A7Y0HY25_9BIFI|nr:prolyl oligopeptidase family serine peptidase [Bifidobacterium sp. DSM 109958]NMN00846.1 cytochrome C [Bifidobacterium sp. DSM 109958]